MECVVVLMSVYGKDSASLLDRSIRSIYCSNGVIPKLVLYIDGQLTNELEEVIEVTSELFGIDIIRSHKNFGLAHALNSLIDYALNKYTTCDYFARMDADDFSYPNRLVTQVCAMQKDTTIAVLGTQVRYVNQQLKPYSVTNFPRENEYICSQLDFKCPINHPTVMFRRSVLLNYRYDNSTSQCEDLELWLRLRKHGLKFANSEQVLLDYTFSISNLMAKRTSAKAESELSIRLSYCMPQKTGFRRLLYKQYLSVLFWARRIPAKPLLVLYRIKNQF